MSKTAYHTIRNRKARKEYPQIHDGIARAIKTEPLTDREIEQLLADARIEQSVVEPLRRFLIKSVAKPTRAQIAFVLRKAVYERDRCRCLKCGSLNGLTLHHIKPVSRNGPTAYDNLQTLCRECHNRMHSGGS